MPFRSSKQRHYLWARKPELAREWTQKYGATPVPAQKAADDTAAKDMARKKKKGKRSSSV